MQSGLKLSGMKTPFLFHKSTSLHLAGHSYEVLRCVKAVLEEIKFKITDGFYRGCSCQGFIE